MNDSIEDLASRLAHRGVKYAFGVTGSGPSLALITALDSRSVKYFPAAHEASAAIMAGAASAVTGGTEVSISIRGPGFANMLPGIINNCYENRPALSISECLSGDVPAWRAHKRLDHRALVEPIVKTRTALDDVPRSLDAVLDYAKEETPGPVHLDLCARTSRDDSVRAPTPTARRHRDKSATNALSLVEAAHRPVVIAGSFAARRGLADRLASLQLPIFTTAAAKGLVDESGDYSAGVFTGDGKRLSPEASILKEADLVIGIGLRVAELLSPKPFGVPTLLLDVARDAAADALATDLVLADGELFEQVLATLASGRWGAEQIAEAKAALSAKLLDGGWLPAACFNILNQLPQNHMLVLDTGSFCTIGEHVWNASRGRPFLASSNSRYMGTAIPTAIGASIANRETPVICVVGDGGMRMYPAELKLAVKEQLPICIILMTDGLYGSVACVPQAFQVNPRAVEIDQPTWFDSVAGMGCAAAIVENESEFDDAVRSWDQQQPLFLESPFDPGRYAGMTSDLR